MPDLSEKCQKVLVGEMFRLELQSALLINSAFLDTFSDYLGKAEVERLKHLLFNSQEDVCEKFIDSVIQSEHPSIFGHILQSLKLIANHQKGKALVDALSCCNVMDPKHYELILENFHELSQSVNVQFFAPKLKAANCLTDNDFGFIQCATTPKAKFKILIQKLPLNNAEWYWRFMELLEGESRELVEKLDPSYHVNKRAHEMELMCDQPITFISIGSDISKAITEKSTQDFDLWIFDECHHCDKQHNYNQLMWDYFHLLYEQQVPRDQLPQIIGFTASLGVGGANTEFQAREFVLNICARLDAHRLVTVQQHKEDLEALVPVPKDELILVKSGHRDNPFAYHVTEIMKHIEEEIQPMLNKLPNTELFAQFKVPPDGKHLPVYQQFVCNLIRNVPTLHDTDLKRGLFTCLEYLKIFYVSLLLNAHVPTYYALNYLNDRVIAFAGRARTSRDKRMAQFYEDRKMFLDKAAEDTKTKVPPIVEKLKEILTKEYQNNSQAKTIVFVQTRELTKALKEYMMHEPSLRPLNPERLVGSGNPQEKKGQTVAQQSEAVKKFRDGKCKVLVATTVAEEGLDISACNLVIKYNHVTHEKALVQRRGRGRAEGSRSILLAQEEQIAQKEVINLKREKLMNESIQFIRTKNNDWFLGEAQKRQKKELDERNLEKRLKEQIKIKLGNRKYDIVCQKCDKVLCDSTRVKKVENMHFVVTDPDIWNRAKITPSEQVGLQRVQVFTYVAILGKVSCGNCGKEFGQVLRYDEVYFATIRADSIVLMCGAEKRTVRKWKKITEEFFPVDSIEPIDRIKMAKAYAENLKQEWDKYNEIIEEERLRQLHEIERRAQALENETQSMEVEQINADILDDDNDAMMRVQETEDARLLNNLEPEEDLIQF